MKDIAQLVDALHKEDLQNEAHPSTFDKNESYDMLIVRFPVIAEELHAKSLGFIFTNTSSYLYEKETKSYKLLDELFMGPYKIIDKGVDKLLQSFIKYQESVSDMEEQLYTTNIQSHFLDSWLSVKLDILRVERILMRSATIIDEFISHYKSVDSFPLNHYMDILEHIERTQRSATLQLSKLDDLYSFYNAKSNDKMNRMIYILTIISAIFLPLNLVVGFFGMNTSGLPFSQGSLGTLFAVGVMIFLAMSTTLFVQKWRKQVEK